MTDVIKKLRTHLANRHGIETLRRLEKEHQEAHRLKHNQWVRPGRKFYQHLKKNPDWVTAQKVKWLLTDKEETITFRRYDPGRTVPPHRSGGARPTSTSVLQEASKDLLAFAKIKLEK